MKTPRILFLLCFSSILLFSCSRNVHHDPEPDPVDEEPQEETTVEFANASLNSGGKTCFVSGSEGDGLTYAYFYDEKNRLVKLTVTEHNELLTSSYLEFTGENKALIRSTGDEEYWDTIHFTLEKGRVSQVKQKSVFDWWDDNQVMYEARDLITIDITRNAEGFVTRWKETTETHWDKPGTLPETTVYTEDYSYTGENLSQTIITEPNGDNSTTITYEYYSDKLNTIPVSYSVTSLVHRPSKNLLKKKIYNKKNGQGNPITETAEYTYEFNSDGFVVKQTEIYTFSDGGTGETVTSFVHLCK